MKREAEGLTKGQALYRVRKLKRDRDAWAIRANDDTYVVFSVPKMKAIRV